MRSSGAGIQPGDALGLSMIAMYAELTGVICSGPRRGKQHTYALIEHRAPHRLRLTRDEALAELARRYFRSHGPATRRDLGWWASLTLADVDRAVGLAGDALMVEAVEDGREWISSPEPVPALGAAAPECLLTPTYDETLMGYRELRLVHAVTPPPDVDLKRPIVIGGRTVGAGSGCSSGGRSGSRRP